MSYSGSTRLCQGRSAGSIPATRTTALTSIEEDPLDKRATVERNHQGGLAFNVGVVQWQDGRLWIC